jgi:transglutaminase/protease-like cytokinesis protein 3
MKKWFRATVAGLALSAMFGVVPAQAATDYTKTIKNHLENHETRFTVTITTSRPDSVVTMFKSALASDPYIHWDTYGWSMTSRWSGNRVTASFRVSYWETKEQSAYVEQTVRKILKQIIRPGMTDLEKEKAIHDWIVQHVQYDTSLKRHSAYAALKEGKAVCQGYALLAYRMLTDAGIPTCFVAGYADGVPHLWNEVKIHGHWYHLDVTFDDPIGASPSDISYDYFNLTDAEIARDHVWDRTQVPRAE